MASFFSVTIILVVVWLGSRIKTLLLGFPEAYLKRFVAELAQVMKCDNNGHARKLLFTQITTAARNKVEMTNGTPFRKLPKLHETRLVTVMFFRHLTMA